VTDTHIPAALRRYLVPIASLREDDRNLRKHRGRSTEAIRLSLQRFGQQAPIVAMPDGTLVSGHGTYRAAKALGWESIAAVTFDGSAALARQYAIADNRTAELSHWDTMRLAASVSAVQAVDARTARALGFSDAELAGLLRLMHPDETDGVDAGAGDTPPTVREYTTDLLFTTVHGRAVWDRWCAWLATRFPGVGTLGARLAAYADEIVADGGLTRPPVPPRPTH
jgi:hypothetical protein